jgi:protein-disulfide isomerase
LPDPTENAGSSWDEVLENRLPHGARAARNTIRFWYEFLQETRFVEKSNTLLSPRTLLALLVAVAIVVAALLVVLSQLGGAGSGSVEDVGEFYSGIPQDGTTLGKGNAPVTVYLYEDFQCPFCGQFSREMFPDLVDDYVRDGQVKLVSETMAFLGPDSVTAARAAFAAGEQNRYWPYHTLLFEKQGEENSGYVTDDFLRGLAEQTPGLDVEKWEDQRAGTSFKQELEAAQSKAQASGVNSTPTLIFKGPGGQAKIDRLTDYDQISSAIDKVDGS